MRVITFGTFDLFHRGHLNLIKRCKNFLNNSHSESNNYLIVGVSSDKLNFEKKNRFPVYNENDRMEIIKSIKYVDKVFLEESLQKKLEYCIKYKADCIIMGDDHIGSFDYLNKYNIKVIYLPRTKNISTSETIEKIKI